MPACLLSVLRFARVAKWGWLGLAGVALCLTAAAHAQSAKFSYAIQTLGGGFTHPLGIAVDGSGNVYATDEANSSVFEIPSGCASSSCVTTIGGGFSSPEGLATDSSGDAYVADYGNKAVKEIPSGCASSGCVRTLGGGFNGPTRVAVNASGTVYVIDPNAVVVKEIPLNPAILSGSITGRSPIRDPISGSESGSNLAFRGSDSFKKLCILPQTPRKRMGSTSSWCDKRTHLELLLSTAPPPLASRR